jgi:hypothetical protein
MHKTSRGERTHPRRLLFSPPSPHFTYTASPTLFSLWPNPMSPQPESTSSS